MFENHRKSLIQHCERSELRLHNKWTKVIQNAKTGQFDEILKTWSLRLDSVTRQVNFNRTKIGGKCQHSKIQMRQFQKYSNYVLVPNLERFWRENSNFVLNSDSYKKSIKRVFLIISSFSSILQSGAKQRKVLFWWEIGTQSINAPKVFSTHSFLKFVTQSYFYNHRNSTIGTLFYGSQGNKKWHFCGQK